MGAGKMRVLGAALLVSAVTTLAACAADNDSSSTSATSSASSAVSSSALASTSSEATSSGAPAAQGDYSSLLIQASDISPEARVKDAPGPIPNGDPGVGASFTDLDGNRYVVVTLPVLADEAAAVAMIDPMKQAIARQVAGSTAEPIDVGSNGFLFQGTRADTSTVAPSEISAVVFNQGKVLVNLEIDSPLGAPTPRDVIIDLARKQADRIKDAPPG